MDNFFFISRITTIIVFSFIYLRKGAVLNKILKVQRIPVTVKAAKEGLEKISSWTTWITGLQTAAIGSMAFLLKNDCLCPLNLLQKKIAFYAILFFGSSIILSAWILSSIPSILVRLPYDEADNSPDNDIYEISIYSFSRFKLGPFTGLVHWYFLCGLVFFSFFIFNFVQN